MANNLVVQLLLKTGAFSSDLKQAKGQIQSFQQGCTTAGKSLDAFGKAIGVDIGALTKFGGAVGAAVVAGKAFKAIIDSNQTSADKFAEVMYVSKTAVGELAYAIGTFDFSNFQNGLSDLIRRAREAAGAIDQLGNTLMSYNIAQAKAQAAIAKARAGQKNPDLSPEEKQALVDAANAALEEAREATEMALQDFETSIVAEVNARGGHVSGEGAMALVDKYLTLDGKRVRDDVKNSMKTVQAAYDKEIADLNNTFSPGSNTSFSNNLGTFGYSDRTWKNNPEYIRRLDEINSKYQELHVYNTLLVKEQDKELERLGQQRVNMYQLEGNLANMDKTLDVIENKVTGTANATKKEAEAAKGSLEYWKKMVQEITTMRDKQEMGTEGWNYWNNRLEEANKELKKVNDEMDKILMKQSKMKYADLAVPITGPKLQGKAEDTSRKQLAGSGVKSSINELEADISALEKARKELNPGGVTNGTKNDDIIKNINQRIAQKRAEISAIEEMGVKSVPNEVINSWEVFGETLSNLSSIASNLSTVMSAVVDDETMKKWNEFFKWVNVGVAAFQAINSAIQVATGLQKLFGKVSQQTSAETAESAATEAAAVVAAKEAEAGAAAGSAGAKGADAVAGIPIVGPALAVAAVAAIMAAILAATSKAKSMKFANGGIVPGTSYTGDRVAAQVNSGEMILNKRQQANLFKIANSGMGGGGQVEFHISGTELVGVLNNQNRKNNLIR